MNYSKNLLYASLIALLVTSCQKEEAKQAITNNLSIPSFYDSSAYFQNIQSVTNISTNMDAMVTEVKKGRLVTGTVSASTLANQFTSGTPSLQSISIGAYSSLLTGNNGWFEKAAKASGKTYHPDTPSTSGGVFGGYLFDENGFEPEQMIEKGLFGAALANHIITLISENPTLAQIDQALHLLGATPHFKSSNASKHGAAADKYLANYVARRDKNDGSGFYSEMKKMFLQLQASVKGGSTFNTQRNQAIASIKSIIEQANYATVINYCHASIANLSKTTMTEAEKAATMHALGECVGFTLGWKTVAGKKISDTQIDEIMVLLNAPVTGGGKPALFITDRVNQITKLQTVISKIQSIYSFTPAQIEDFKKNWVAEQSR
jgi:hypothetical protein